MYPILLTFIIFLIVLVGGYMVVQRSKINQLMNTRQNKRLITYWLFRIIPPMSYKFNLICCRRFEKLMNQDL